jgi:multiple sugar transport system permease protein
MDRRPSGRLGSDALHLVLPSLVLALFVAPLVLALLGSLRPPGTAPPTSIDLWPAGAGASNYADVLGRPVLRQQLLNTLLVAAIAVPAGTLVASWAGFAIARLPRRAAFVLLGITVIAIAMPASTMLIGITPLLVLLFAWSYHTIPREIYDLAAEAGLGQIGTWWRVAVPMRRGAVAVAVAVAFVTSWGNLSDPLLYIYDERWFTLPLGLVSLAELPPTDQGLMLAAAVIAIAPALVTAYLVQRHLYERRV